MRVVNAVNASASLVLTNVRRVSTMPSATPLKHTVTGLLDGNAPNELRCTSSIGSSATPLQLRLQNSRRSLLRVDCPAAASLSLHNDNGRCLHAVWADAGRITTSGNKSISVFVSPQRTRRTVINVSKMTSFGRDFDGPSTRVVVRLSQWEAHADRASLVTVQGRLPFNVPSSVSFVIVQGCGALEVDCRVVDKSGALSCQYLDVCLASAAAAKAKALAAINSSNPCLPPQP